MRCRGVTALNVSREFEEENSRNRHERSILRELVFLSIEIEGSAAIHCSKIIIRRVLRRATMRTEAGKTTHKGGDKVTVPKAASSGRAAVAAAASIQPESNDNEQMDARVNQRLGMMFRARFQERVKKPPIIPQPSPMPELITKRTDGDVPERHGSVFAHCSQDCTKSDSPKWKEKGLVHRHVRIGLCPKCLNGGAVGMQCSFCDKKGVHSSHFIVMEGDNEISPMFVTEWLYNDIDVFPALNYEMELFDEDYIPPVMEDEDNEFESDEEDGQGYDQNMTMAWTDELQHRIQSFSGKEEDKPEYKPAYIPKGGKKIKKRKTHG